MARVDGAPPLRGRRGLGTWALIFPAYGNRWPIRVDSSPYYGVYWSVTDISSEWKDGNSFWQT